MNDATRDQVDVFKKAQSEKPSAFPLVIQLSETTLIASGMTKREFITTAAMQGLLAGQGSLSSKAPSHIASCAVECADALINRLKQGTPT